ncbi:uncharacterized protein BCR38DRAFT_406712 [Pseudomassariella vexata]|uniref:Uncharacterized protein n=1 Tax=Pseudomassariella vexata TaxID=1141098 RepID=A0A1Y2EB64_9PEZI|nr:uncharacterized protein BCR38DRAFT_406712 [Pseudomassariella vexata]ORY68823.1 hypothetical protein BCR38DRAFT_406712 [Pseudomassariella vexata]
MDLPTPTGQEQQLHDEGCFPSQPCFHSGGLLGGNRASNVRAQPFSLAGLVTLQQDTQSWFDQCQTQTKCGFEAKKPSTIWIWLSSPMILWDHPSSPLRSGTINKCSASVPANVVSFAGFVLWAELRRPPGRQGFLAVVSKRTISESLCPKNSRVDMSLDP